MYRLHAIIELIYSFRCSVSVKAWSKQSISIVQGLFFIQLDASRTPCQSPLVQSPPSSGSSVIISIGGNGLVPKAKRHLTINAPKLLRTTDAPPTGHLCAEKLRQS